MFFVKLPIILLLSLSSISSTFGPQKKSNDETEEKTLVHRQIKFSKDKTNLFAHKIPKFSNSSSAKATKTEVISSFTRIDEIFNNKKEQEDKTSSRRITTLYFDKDIFTNSDLTTKNYALEVGIANNIIFNNKTIYEIASKDSKVELLKESNKSLVLKLPVKYFAKQIAQDFIMLSFKNLTMSSNTKISKFDLVLVNGKWCLDRDFSVETLKQTKFVENDGYQLRFTSKFTVDPRIDLSKTPFNVGTYLVNKNAYEDSSFSAISSYIENNVEGLNTYKNYELNEHIFKIEVESPEITTYSFEYDAKLDKENYRQDLIPVGYLKINGKNYYGQSGDYFCSLHDELVKLHVDPHDYEDVFDELFVATLNSTNKNYELTNNSFDKDVCTLTYDGNGYYKVTANNKITQFVVNGKAFNRQLAKGESVYVSAYRDQVKFSANQVKMKLGFSEPNYDVYSDFNSTTKNTYANNAAIQSEFNAKTARIWVTTSFLLDSAWPSIGLVDPMRIDGNYLNDFDNCSTYNIKFKANSIKALQDTISAYRAAGVEEINLMVNGFVYSYTDNFFYIPGDASNKTQMTSWFNSIRLGMAATHSNVFPKADSESYQRWLNGNKEFYKKIFDLFDIDFVEPLNEINLAPCVKSPEYLENYIPGITPTYPGVEMEKYYREQVVGYTMDYCKIITDAANESTNNNVRVMTPAIAVVGDYETLPSFVAEGTMAQVRDGGVFLDMCYDYIESQNKSPSEYFQVLNLHPYVFYDSTTAQNGNYLYDTSGSKKVFNSNYVTNWVSSMNNLYQICVDHNDGYIPFIATEFGFTDYAGINETGLYPSNDKINFGTSDILPNAINALIPAARDLDYFYSLQWFRMYSFGNKYNVSIQTSISDTDFDAWNQFITDMSAIRCYNIVCTGSSGGKFTATATIDYDSLDFETTGYTKKTCKATYQGHTYTITDLNDAGEPNFGFIAKDFTLKKWGKTLYTQFTGKTDTSSIDALLQSLKSQII